jgi:hypothetical protein
MFWIGPARMMQNAVMLVPGMLEGDPGLQLLREDYWAHVTRENHVPYPLR